MQEQHRRGDAFRLRAQPTCPPQRIPGSPPQHPGAGTPRFLSLPAPPAPTYKSALLIASFSFVDKEFSLRNVTTSSTVTAAAATAAPPAISSAQAAKGPGLPHAPRSPAEPRNSSII